MRPDVETTAGMKARRISWAASRPDICQPSPVAAGRARSRCPDHVRMTQGAILRRVISAAMKVVNPGSIKAYPATPIQQHLGDVYVRSNVLILGDRDCGDTGDDDVSS